MTSSTGAEQYEPSGGQIAQPAAFGAGGGAPPAPPAAPSPPEVAPAPPPPPPPPGGMALRQRTEWVEVPGYPGYQVRLWLNYPRHWERDIQGADFRPMPPRPAGAEDGAHEDEDARAEALRVWVEEITRWTREREAAMREALGRVVLEHNGWRDYDPPVGTGLVLPQPQSPDFWEAIPQELMDAVLALRQERVQALPLAIRNSTPRRRRS